MILSMTGFGRGVASSETNKITVEIKSLNSKQLDLSMRIPSLLRESEGNLRNIIAHALERGKVDVMLFAERIGANSPSFLNTELLKAYKMQIENLDKILGIDPPADWHATLLRLPDALIPDNTELSDDDRKALREAAGQALSQLVDFRKSEGEKLFCFFEEKIKNIGNLLAQIEPFETERVERIKTRLFEQLEKLPGVEYDAGRLEQELIYYIEKLDVSEEKQRLNSHLNYFLETMGPSDETPEGTMGRGKKLGFISQEMGREINTLGSKSNNAEMQKIVVMMKDELEQIKEQVLNVL